ncbi:MAG: hypothetical protein MZW92_20325 [Comamonadaceae bacterium]|nr:hypothetical protein [Comamonadaceae bacterium]
MLSELMLHRSGGEGAETTLAQEIDMVTGVSGGMAAAHLALHGVRDHLVRFPTEFRMSTSGVVPVAAILSPWNLHRVTSRWYGRGNVLADEFDAALFKGATFGRLAQLGGRPT